MSPDSAPSAANHTPSPGTPGEGGGEGSAGSSNNPDNQQNPHPALSRRTGRGFNDAIVITGCSLTTSLGLDRESTWQSVLAAKSNFGPMSAMESPLPPGKDGSQSLDLPADFAADLPREARYLRWTISAAIADAGLTESMPYDRSRCTILLGTTLHGIRSGGDFLRTGDFGKLVNFPAGATLKLAAEGLPFGGAGLTICSACSSSLGSIAMAVTLLQTGQADCVIAGGYDTISEYVYGGFNALRLVAEGPLRPFSKDRKGMKLAEGYGIVILERAGDAAARGHSPIAQILGWGESADAHHLTQPHPEGDGAARAMAAALRRANLTPASIDMIAAHATGTPDNDAGEFAALSRTFGADLPRVPVVGFKSHLGHTLGGAGAVELILSALALRDQIVPACANITAADIEFAGLNVSVGNPKPAKIRATLNTSLGFGGANTCVVLSLPLPSGERAGVRGETSGDESLTLANPSPVNRDEANQRPLLIERSAPHLTSPLRGEGPDAPFAREVFITGVGVIAPGVVGREGLLHRLQNPPPAAALTEPIGDAALEGLLNARRVRRLSDYVKLQLASATLAIRDAGIGELGDLAAQFSAILGSAHGSANYSYNYYEQIVREGVMGANPMLFAEGVPNAGAAHISLMLGLKGACQSVIGTRTAGLDALALAAARIASGEWDRAIVGAGEEEFDIVRKAYQHCGLACKGEPSGAFAGDGGFLCAGGAAAIVLESKSAVEARGGKPIGRITHAGFVRGDRKRLASSLAELLKRIDAPPAVMSSAAGVWLDQLEAAALSQAGVKSVSSIAGYIAETFSATPLMGIAAVLAAKRLPRLLSYPTGLGSMCPADGSEKIDRFAALCSDPTGIASGVNIMIL